MIEALIYDMDGLLVDSEPVWRDVEIACFSAVGLHLTPEECMQTKGLRIDEVVEYWYRKSPWGKISQNELISIIMRQMVAEMQKNATALPGVYKSLELANQLGLKTAIASSSQLQLINAVVKGLGLEKSFDAYCSAESEAFGKPHPAVFLTAAKQLGVNPESCLVLEDSLPGIIAAKAAKMKCIAVPEEQDIANPKFQIADIILTSLSEFKESTLNQFK